MLTLGIDFYSKEEKINGKNIKIKLWDTAGQEKYHTLPYSYYKKCDGVLITFDVTNKESFDKIYCWVKTVKENINDKNNTKIVLIGNKIDLKEEREISEDDGKKIAKEYNMNYYETSAKENIGINELMKDLIKDILNSRLKIKNEKETNNNDKNEIKIEQTKTKNENECSC